jgi:hypothetical protein
MSGEPLCVRVRRESLERDPGPLDEKRKALANRAYWHQDAEKHDLGGCPLCSYLAGLQATEHAYNTTVINENDLNGRGAALVERGVWTDEQIYTAREMAERTSRAFLRGKR